MTAITATAITRTFDLLNFKFVYSFSSGGLVAKSCPTLATPWIAAHQAPLSMGFPRQEYWGGLPFSTPGEFPGPGIESQSPA